MRIKMILFDLDGTLLPMDQKVFMKDYFGRLVKKIAPVGYNPQALVDAIWAGTADMVQNDGSVLNETRFWNRFCAIFGEEAKQHLPLFDEFYREEFDKIRSSCGYNPKAAQAVRTLKSMGYRVALATNPLFPSIATEKRTSWTGLSTDDFELFTAYDNTGYCKPNPDYYRDVCRRLDVSPEECLMVGNDAEEDMIAATLGMKVFLLTDCLINRKEIDLAPFPQGDFDALLDFVKTI